MFFPLLLPIYLAQRATIPFAAAGPGYQLPWLLASLGCCPLAFVAYLGLLGSWSALVALVAGAGAAAAVWAFTR